VEAIAGLIMGSWQGHLLLNKRSGGRPMQGIRTLQTDKNTGSHQTETQWQGPESRARMKLAMNSMRRSIRSSLILTLIVGLLAVPAVASAAEGAPQGMFGQALARGPVFAILAAFVGG